MVQAEILNLLSVLSLNYPELEKIVVYGSGSGDSFDSFYEYTFTPDIKFKDIESNEDLDAILEEALECSSADFNDNGSRVEITVDLKNKQVTTEVWYYVHEENWEGKYNLIKNDDQTNNRPSTIN